MSSSRKKRQAKYHELSPEIPQKHRKFKYPQGLTVNQKRYLQAIDNNDVVICNGPAGVGKTHLAVGMACKYLIKGFINKIVLARPVVTAGGEQLGHLPGDMGDKMNPYVRPCYDELEKFLSFSEIKEWENEGLLEVVPIAYMRGRSIDCFIVIDEAQNTNFDQMKMICTRLGQAGKMVINGDSSQIDLPRRERGAFDFACKLMREIEFADYVEMTGEDNQRHEFVQVFDEMWENNIDIYRRSGTLRM